MVDANKGWGYKVVYFLSPLIMEKNSDGEYTLTTGRVAFWAVFVLAYFKWFHQIGLPSGMLETLYALLGYNVLKIPVQSIVSAKAQLMGSNPIGSIPSVPIVPVVQPVVPVAQVPIPPAPPQHQPIVIPVNNDAADDGDGDNKKVVTKDPNDS